MRRSDQIPTLSRRDVVVGAFALSPLGSQAFAESPAEALVRKAQESANPAILGHVIPPPSDPVWKQAQSILDAAPRSVSPYEVAEYFINSVPEKFQAAWPEPDRSHPTVANPLIVLFFLATRTKPEGDTTAWCAAFVNWCLERSGLAGTANAASQSFLSWGSSVWRAGDGNLSSVTKQGDIAVFRDRADQAHGHVCFFQAIDRTQPNHVLVVGGNQYTHAHLHVIDVKSLRTDGGLELVSIRRAPGLQRA